MRSPAGRGGVYIGVEVVHMYNSHYDFSESKTYNSKFKILSLKFKLKVKHHRMPPKKGKKTKKATKPRDRDRESSSESDGVAAEEAPLADLGGPSGDPNIAEEAGEASDGGGSMEANQAELERLAQFFEERPYFYDMADERYKLKTRKNSELAEFAKTLGPRWTGKYVHKFIPKYANMQILIF